MIKKLCALLLVTALVGWSLVSPPFAASANTKDDGLDFGGVVKLIESHYRVKGKGLPWVARVGIKAAQPFTRLAGYGAIKVVHFEDQDFTSPARGVDFHEVMRGALKPAWSPLVEVQARAANEQTLVYYREAGDRFKVLVVTIGARDGTAVQVELSQSKMAELMKDPNKMSKVINEDTTSGAEPE